MQTFSLWTFFTVAFCMTAPYAHAAAAPGGQCGGAVATALVENGYGMQLDKLKPGVKVDSFRVEDVQKSMKVAMAAVHSLPEGLEIADDKRAEYDRLVKNAEAIRDKVDEVDLSLRRANRERDDLLSLVEDSTKFGKSYAYFNRAVTTSVRALEVVYRESEQAEAAIREFLAKNSLVENFSSQGKRTLKKANSQREALDAAIQSGDVADASRRLRQIEAARVAGGTVPPFDEIVVVRHASFAEQAAMLEKHKAAYEAQVEQGYASERIVKLKDFLKTSRPAAVKAEIEAEIARLERRVASLKPKVDESIRLEKELSENAGKRPVTILKKGGRVVGALTDGSFLAGKELGSMSQGFFCQGDDIPLAWLGSHYGFVNRETCWKIHPIESCLSAFAASRLDIPKQVAPSRNGGPAPASGRGTSR